ATRTASAPSRAAAATSARDAAMWLWATPQMTGTRPAAASTTVASTARRVLSSREAFSPVDPSGTRPLTPPFKTWSTKRRMAGTSAAPSCVSGEIRAGSTPCSASILCTAQGYSLLVTQRLSRCDTRSSACRQEGCEQCGHIGAGGDEADVDYGHVEDHRAESLVIDEEAIRLPHADQCADDQPDDRDEAGLHQERLLDA